VITTRQVRTMVTVVVLVLVAIVVVEVHWSMDTKSTAGTVAREAAGAAAQTLLTSHDSLAARHAAEAVSAAHGFAFIAFTTENDGSIRVTVSGRSRSYLLRWLGPLRSITEVSATATAHQR
jgi:Flp pilus assembly protein TadG